jgi:C-terminal processing protease CtpA/Prc
MSLMDLVSFARLKDTFTKPQEHAMPTWRPMSKQESKRLIWLGVEFDPITKELAKQLGVDKPTRGGAVGLMVSSIYAGSPAEKAGIKPQDILLRLEVKGLGDPVPLLSSRGGATEALMDRMGGMAGRGGMRTWRPRINMLTVILTAAGPGHRAEVVYYSAAEKKVKKASWKMAYGPVDFDSAEKHKDDKLGLSVKPLTYEVRRALALEVEDPGVIISRVERGSAAQLARLTPYMVITHIEGQAIKSVDEFKKKIAALREGKKEKAKLQVSIMGKSRFADLKLEE